MAIIYVEYYRALKSCEQSKKNEVEERGGGGSNCMYKRTFTSGEKRQGEKG